MCLWLFNPIYRYDFVCVSTLSSLAIIKGEKKTTTNTEKFHHLTFVSFHFVPSCVDTEPELYSKNLALALRAIVCSFVSFYFRINFTGKKKHRKTKQFSLSFEYYHRIGCIFWDSNKLFFPFLPLSHTLTLSRSRNFPFNWTNSGIYPFRFACINESC